MFAYVWPIALIIISGIIYQISAKEVPSAMDGFSSLTICYGIATLVTLVLFFITAGTGISGLLAEYAKINWAVVVLGITAVGLEVGYVFAYKSGWEVSLVYVMQASILAGLLLVVGYFLYSEGLTWNKVVGVGICLVGLILLNRKGGTK